MDKIKILIVDDDENIIKSLKRFLDTKENLEIITLTNPQKALEMIKTSKVHIVLSDIQMPEMDGLEFLRQVKKVDAMAQFIVMTAYPTMERIMQALENGANDFVLKPFESLDFLWDTINLSINKLSRWRKVLRNNFSHHKRWG